MKKAPNHQKKIGQRVRMVRKKLDLTQKQFGELIGRFSQQSISLYESGRLELPIAALLKIVEAGKVSLGWLLTGKGTGAAGASSARERAPKYQARGLTAEERRMLRLLRENPELKRIIRKYARSKKGVRGAMEELVKLVQKQTAGIGGGET